VPRTEQANQQIRDERKAQILAAAAQVFAVNGYMGTRIEDIAGEAQMSKGLLYHYFGSKDRLFNTLIESASRGTVHVYQEAFDRPGPATVRLEWLVSQVLEGLRDHPHMFMVVMQALVSNVVPDEARKSAKWLLEETQRLTREFIREGQAAGEIVAGPPAYLAILLGSCLQGLAVANVLEEPVPSISEVLVMLFTRTPAVIATS